MEDEEVVYISRQQYQIVHEVETERDSDREYSYHVQNHKDWNNHQDQLFYNPSVRCLALSLILLWEELVHPVGSS